jgi:hypothetical protein
MSYFGFKKDLQQRGEHAFYYALVKLIPELIESERCLDESIQSKLLGQPKSIYDTRPDYFHLFSDGDISMAIHGEYDEGRDHEDSDSRLHGIAESAGCKDTTYVIRICARHDEASALCTRRVYNTHYTYYDLTPRGQQVLEQQVVPVFQERLEWIKQGLAPNVDRPWKVKINF